MITENELKDPILVIMICTNAYFSQVEVKYVSKQAILKIKKAEKKHEGTYYCHAENRHGKAVLLCNLYVTDTDLGKFLPYRKNI